MTEHRRTIIHVDDGQCQGRRGRQRHGLAVVERHHAEFHRRMTSWLFVVEDDGCRHHTGCPIDRHRRKRRRCRRSGVPLFVDGVELAKRKLDAPVFADILVAGDEPDEGLPDRKFLGDGSRVRGSIEARRVVIGIGYSDDEVA